MRRRSNRDHITRVQQAIELRSRNGVNRRSRRSTKRGLKERMLDLSASITEECVYPKCEGGLTCAATRTCVAREARVVGSHLARPEWRCTAVDMTLQFGQTKSEWRVPVVSMTSGEHRHPTQVKVKLVRQCARRGFRLPTCRRLHLYSVTMLLGRCTCGSSRKEKGPGQEGREEAGPRKEGSRSAPRPRRPSSGLRLGSP